jgi:hypothetical protein
MSVRSASGRLPSPEVSRRWALWGSLQEAKARASSECRCSQDGPYRPYSFTTIVAPDRLPPANARFNARVRSQLFSKITERDRALLIALAGFRYLDMRQIQSLFFPSQRTAQMRIHQLLELGLVQRWKIFETNFYRWPSVILLAPRGAALVAELLDWNRTANIERAHLAADRRGRFWRTLSASWFFVRLAEASPSAGRMGLYRCLGPADLLPDDGSGLVTEGCGLYLFPDGDVAFDLDWARADLERHWLRRRLDLYFRYFVCNVDPPIHHVLFVARSERGERRLVSAVRRQHRSWFRSYQRSWVTTIDRIDREGPLGTIWRYAYSFPHEPEGWVAPDQAERLRLEDFPKAPPEHVDPRGCIGRPQWWRFRPLGAGGP